MLAVTALQGAGSAADVPVYAVGLKDYVAFLEQAAPFRQAVRARDFITAHRIQRAMIRCCPEITSGYEMGLIIGALQPDEDLLHSSLRDMTDKYLLYPDTYQTIAALPPTIEDPLLRERAREAIQTFFVRRTAFLSRKLERGLDRTALHTELFHLGVVMGDQEIALRHLAELGLSGYNLLRQLDRNARWQDNTAFTRLRREMDARWHRWEGTTEQKMGGLLQAATEMRRLSAALIFSEVTDWNLHLQEHLPSILNAGTRLEYYEALAAVIHRVGDNHTFLHFPADLEDDFADCALELRLVGNSILVSEVQADDLAAAVDVGDEIVTLNGMNPTEYISARRDRYPFVLHYHFRPELYARHQTSKRLLVGPRNSLVEVGFRRPDQTLYTLKLHREHPTPDARARIREAGLPPVSLFRLRPDILCLTIRTFATDIYGPFLECIREVDPATVRGVIFDLRQNPGGHSGEGEAIFAHFIDQPAANYLHDYVPVIIPHKVARDHGHIRQYKAGDMIQPAEGKRFDCPVILLVSPDTASAAEDFTWLFQHHGRGRVLGLTTSGATGEGHRVYLPGGGYLRINLNVNLGLYGQGITPDEIVDWTQADIANGRDTQLRRAQAILSPPQETQ
jgi:C-terminal processing protease CtpA/Prc